MEPKIAEVLTEALKAHTFDNRALENAVAFATSNEERGILPAQYFPEGIIVNDVFHANGVALDYRFTQETELKDFVGRILRDPLRRGGTILINGTVLGDAFTARVTIAE